MQPGTQQERDSAGADDPGKETGMKKFWNWIRDDAGGRTLRLEGPIDSESFWGDEVTPKAFRDDLYAEDGDITVYINSPGGNVFAAAEIYTMLGEYPGHVTVKIDSIAASAASVVAMAGDRVMMSPVAMIMVHDPSTIAMGNAKDMEKAITTLNEVKESIINAYQNKTGLSRNRISKLMENETWMNAKKAAELGFADEILFTDRQKPEDPEDPDGDGLEEGEGDGKKKEAGIQVAESRGLWEREASLYSTKVMGETILNRLSCYDTAGEGPAEAGTPEEPAEDGVGSDGEDSEGVDADDTGNNPTETPSADTGTKPVIGMDGKTEDGAVPYEILKKKLEWLR